MGIVNATPDSFSDAGERRTLDERVGRARELLRGRRSVIDIGGESGVTNRPAVDPREEIERVVPLIERVAGELGAIVSVDTYKPSVARAASPPARRSSTTSAACATRSWPTCAPRPAPGWS